MLLTRKERFLIWVVTDTIRTLWKIFIALCGELWFLSKVIYKGLKYIYNYLYYKKHGFSYDKIEYKINHMSGRAFEVYCSEMFKYLDYEVELTPPSNDGGVDIFLYKDGIKYAVECKRWSGDWVAGREPLSKLVGSSMWKKADRMIFICTNGFNNNAKEFAESFDNLELWTMKDIIKVTKKISKDKIPGIMAKVSLYQEKE